MIRFNYQKKGGNYYERNKLLMEKNKWLAIKGHDQDVTQENFIDNVLMVYEWIISDVERM